MSGNHYLPDGWVSSIHTARAGEGDALSTARRVRFSEVYSGRPTAYQGSTHMPNTQGHEVCQSQMVDGCGTAQPSRTVVVEDLVTSGASRPAFGSVETHPQWSSLKIGAPTFLPPSSLPLSSSGISVRYPTPMPTSVPGPRWRQEHSTSNIGPQEMDHPTSGRSSVMPASVPKRHPPRSTHDEFDGPHQFLPSGRMTVSKENDLPRVQAHLLIQEQDTILGKVNDRLSQCAFDFVAKYQFPIPLEQDKRPVQCPSDREWNEWVFLLKRLATKRRIPARVIYSGQIKQLVTILENSLEMRHAAKHQSRPLKDDRNVLQLISAGLQVAKLLKDAACMQYMDTLYLETERLIQSRKASPARLNPTISGR